MPKDERRAIEFDDDDNGRLRAVWSRSGKNLIVTGTTRRWDKFVQVELRPEQVETLIAFLAETVALQPRDR
jgi:hypothetical protein